MRAKVIVGILLASSPLLGAPAVQADPGPVIRFLMDEPPSMLTFGLWRTTQKLEEIADEVLGEGAWGYADYNWEQNRIILGLGTLTPDALEKETCRQVVVRTRGTFGISPTSGTPVLSRGYSFLGGYFEQTGHRRANEPDDLGKKLDGIALIEVRGAQGIVCEAPLLGTTIDFRER